MSAARPPLSPAVMNAAFMRAVKEDDARRRWPTSPLAFRDADKVLAFAKALLARGPADPLSDIPGHLLLGQQISTRDPALSPDEATLLWRMLGRLNHLETLDLEDGDGIFKDIPTTEIEASPLSFPKLEYLSYTMLYAVEYCNMFLASLRDAPLNTLALYYPDYIDEEETHPPDLALLLSHPCLTNLASLEVEHLRFEYLTLPSPDTAPRFLNMDRLALEITLDDETPRQGILGFLLTLFPYLSSLTITTRDVRSLTDEPQTNALEAVNSANVAAHAAAQHTLQLSYLSASLLDIFLLGLPCPDDEMNITGIDLWTVQHAIDLMVKTFAGTAPHRISVAFTEAADAPPLALYGFLGYVREYWDAFPHTGIPQEIKLDIRVNHREGVEKVLDFALALAFNSLRLEYYTLNIRLKCKAHHPRPRRYSDSSEDSDEGPSGLTRCTEAHLFFVQAQHHMTTHTGTLAQASAAGLRHYSINVSSYCDASWRTLAQSTGSAQNRIMDWLSTT